MKIAYVGTQCSGKTTVLWATGVLLKNMGVTDFTLIGENARECPYPLNMGATFLTTNWVLSQQILDEARAESKWGHVISDRSVVDQLIYFEHSLRRGHKTPFCSSREHSELHYVRRVITAWLELAPYDHIFFFRPLRLVADADRPPDMIYQLEIDNMFAAAIKVYFDEDKVVEIDFPERRRRCDTVAARVYEAIVRERESVKK